MLWAKFKKANLSPAPALLILIVSVAFVIFVSSPSKTQLAVDSLSLSRDAARSLVIAKVKRDRDDAN